MATFLDVLADGSPMAAAARAGGPLATVYAALENDEGSADSRSSWTSTPDRLPRFDETPAENAPNADEEMTGRSDRLSIAPEAAMKPRFLVCGVG
jgi:hypothetical protein